MSRKEESTDERWVRASLAFDMWDPLQRPMGEIVRTLQQQQKEQSVRRGTLQRHLQSWLQKGYTIDTVIQTLVALGWRPPPGTSGVDIQSLLTHLTQTAPQEPGTSSLDDFAMALDGIDDLLAGQDE